MDVTRKIEDDEVILTRVVRRSSLSSFWKRKKEWSWLASELAEVSTRPTLSLETKEDRTE